MESSEPDTIRVNGSIEAVHVVESEVSFLDQLPWEDVVYKYILQYLKLKELFRLRGASRLCKRCVNGYFTKMRKLLLVNLGTKFTSTSLNIITNENFLMRTLIIRNANDWANDDVILPVIERSVNLERVDLSQTTTIGNRVIQRLGIVSGKYLQELVLRECHWLTGVALIQVATNCPKLKKLDITGCWEIQDKAIIHIGMLCKELQFLSVSKIYGLTDRSISEIAKNLPKLRHINLQGCWRISDQSMFLLAEYCKELNTVQVKECRDVSMECLDKMKAKGIRNDVKKPKLTPRHYMFMKALPM